MENQYLRTLKDEVARYMGALRDVVVLAPSYGMLMFHLLNDPRLTRQHRLLVDAAIAYLVSSDDVIPEDQVGPYGYLDDIFCCAFVANRIGRDLGWEVLEEAWAGDGTAHEVSQALLGREQELLGTTGEDVLRFAGLDDVLEDRDEDGGSSVGGRAVLGGGGSAA